MHGLKHRLCRCITQSAQSRKKIYLLVFYKFRNFALQQSKCQKLVLRRPRCAITFRSVPRYHGDAISTQTWSSAIEINGGLQYFRTSLPIQPVNMPQLPDLLGHLRSHHDHLMTAEMKRP